LPRCLEAIAAQTYRDFEFLIVDSTPDAEAPGHRERTGAAVAAAPVAARYIHSAVRLGPHEARNVGARHARGELLVFTDPDIYPEAEWLAALVRAHDQTGGVIFGPIACHGRRWFDIGVHLCKFPICLPERRVRPVPYGWSGNMLCSRSAFDAAGAFPRNPWHGDTVLSVRLRATGATLLFAPGAVVRHDHEGVTLRQFLRERFERGRELAWISADGTLSGLPWTRRQRLRRVLTSLFWPLKVALACVNVGRGAWRASLLNDFVLTFPVIAAGQSAWVLGASLTYLADFTTSAPAAVRERRRSIVAAFLGASRRADLAALLALLHPDAVLRADAAAAGMGTVAETRGAKAVAETFKGRAQVAELALIDGEPGAVWSPGPRPYVAFVFTIAGDRIRAIDLVADAARIGAMEIAVLRE
jgi:GT2 family glycosyltransferase